MAPTMECHIRLYYYNIHTLDQHIIHQTGGKASETDEILQLKVLLIRKL